MSLPSSGRLPLRALLGLLVGSTVAIFFMIGQAWMGILRMEDANVRQEALLSLRGEILYNTEKMMTHARLYTRTMEPVWLERYISSKAGLEQNLAEIYSMTPQAIVEFGEEIESNKDHLNELEQASFLLMQQRFRQEGLDLLSGAEYLAFRDNLTENLMHLSERLTQINVSEEDAAREKIYWRCALVVAVLIALLGVWIFCLRLLVSWRERLLLEAEQRSHVESRFSTQS